MVDYIVKRGETTEKATVLADSGSAAVVRLGDRTVELTLRPLADGRLVVEHQGKRLSLREFADREQTVIVSGTAQRRYELVDARKAAVLGRSGGKGATGGQIKASMPGRVVKIAVAVGDIVPPGSVVAVLEAMKMENDVKAPGGGRVAAIVVQVGATVETGQLLVQLEAAS